MNTDEFIVVTHISKDAHLYLELSHLTSIQHRSVAVETYRAVIQAGHSVEKMVIA